MSSYSVEVTEKDGKKQVRLSGSIIINHIEKVYDELKSQITPDDEVDLVVENPENIDITFVQLVLSMKKAWKESGKALNITTTLPDDLTTLLAKAGISLDTLNQKA
ncbi:MAG: STAS domain-containing protein [Bacteroidales bacterium]|nr:STAS domain-containing protein [Bacteroidales bacterium]